MRLNKNHNQQVSLIHGITDNAISAITIKFRIKLTSGRTEKKKNILTKDNISNEKRSTEILTE